MFAPIIKAIIMKLFFIFFFLISLSVNAELGSSIPGHYGNQKVFSKEGVPLPEKGYNKSKCFIEPKILRAMVSRMRQISFRLDKKCVKGRGEVQVDSCVDHIEGGKEILNTLNRQYQVIENVCSPN
jgi:hypothetical protein